MEGWDWLPVLGAFLGAVVGAGGGVWAARHRSRSEDSARRWELKQRVYFDVLTELDEHQDSIYSWRQDGTEDEFQNRVDALVLSSRALGRMRSKCIVVGGVPVAGLIDDVLELHRAHFPNEVTSDRMRFYYEAILKRMNEEIGETRNPKTKAPEPIGPQFCAQ